MIGRLAYLGVPVSIVVVLVGFLQIAGDLEGGIITILAGFCGGVLSAILGSAFLSGRAWARRFYLWVTPVLLAVEIVVGDNGVLQSGFNWWRFVLSLGVYCAIAFALTRPKSRAFFKTKARMDGTAA